RVDLLAGRRQPLDRQLLDPLAQPVELGTGLVVFEGENQENALGPRNSGGCRLGNSLHRNGKEAFQSEGQCQISVHAGDCNRARMASAQNRKGRSAIMATSGRHSWAAESPGSPEA